MKRQWDGHTNPGDFPQNTHCEVGYFDTNGTSDPTSKSANIASVQRVDDGTDAWYRVTFVEAGPYNLAWTRSAEISNLITTQLEATVLTDGNATSPALGAVNGRKELDIGVYVSGSAVYVNNTAAGHRVSFSLYIDAGETAGIPVI